MHTINNHNTLLYKHNFDQACSDIAAYYDRPFEELPLAERENLLTVTAKTYPDWALDALADDLDQVLSYITDYMDTAKPDNKTDLMHKCIHLIYSSFEPYVAANYNRILENVRDERYAELGVRRIKLAAGE